MGKQSSVSLGHLEDRIKTLAFLEKKTFSAMTKELISEAFGHRNRAINRKVDKIARELNQKKKK